MTLLKWALIFFVVSIVAGILGFTGVSAASADVARFLFYIFVVIFLVLLDPRAYDLQGVAGEPQRHGEASVMRGQSLVNAPGMTRKVDASFGIRPQATSSILTLSG